MSMKAKLGQSTQQQKAYTPAVPARSGAAPVQQAPATPTK